MVGGPGAGAAATPRAGTMSNAAKVNTIEI
jgi:hypothetical protein